MSTKTSSSVKLLHLNQDVLHEIFGYLDRHHLCFSVRNVCKAMKIHVESFLPASEKFAFVDQSNSNLYYICIDIFHIFKGKSNLSMLGRKVRKVLPDFSWPKSINNSRESVTFVEPIGFFGGVMQERIIVGYFCVEKISKPKSLHCLWERLGRKRSSIRRFCKLLPYLYEYEESTKAWKSILPHKKEHMGYIKYEHKVQGDLSFSKVGNTFIVGLRMKASCQLNEVGDPVYAWMDSQIAKFHFYTIKDPSYVVKDNRSMIEYSVSFFEVPPQIKEEKLYYTVSLKDSNQKIAGHYNDNMYFHGFNQSNGDHNFFICPLQSRLFRLNALNEEIRFHKLPVREGRKKSVSFKLKSNIYTITLFENKFNWHNFNPELKERPILPRILQPRLKFTTKTVSAFECDRYDIDRDEYFTSEFEIPNRINDIYSAETDVNESYALILTNIGLIPFTTKNGFEYGIETEDRWINLESINRIYLQD